MEAELRTKIETHLKALRKADSQAAAVAWMTAAYKLFEQCVAEIDRPEAATRLVFMPPQIIEVIREIPKYIVEGKVKTFERPRETWWNAKTVVYPEAPMPVRQPRPWTHRDTVRLEAAAKNTKQPIQRRGK